MPHSRRWRRSAILAGTVAPLALVLTAAPSGAAPPSPRGGPEHLSAAAHARIAAALREAGARDDGDEGGETEQIMDQAEQYAAVRTAPAATVSSGAFRAAAAQAAALPVLSGAWRERTDQVYNSDAVNYRDPDWSNSSGGAGNVSGRMTSLATDGDTVYGGAADGGVWKSTDKGVHWKPVFDQQTRLSIGAIAINPADHSVWVGTGEPNTNADGINGDGIYRSGDGGRHWKLVGNRVQNSLVYTITFDGRGSVYAATSRGLLRRDALDPTAAWSVVLKPDPNPTSSPYRTSFVTDVKVRPGTHGQTVLAVVGWRGGTLPADITHNGFYISTAGGATGTWSKITPAGIDPAAIGRTTFSWAADGSNLYAVVEDPRTITFAGVFRSASGDPRGPWTLVADSDKLAKSGSALDAPGGQAWYDQYVQVDPKDPSHVYVGLEEVFETTTAGASWQAIGRYWNFPFTCWSVIPSQNTCPGTTHADQHAVALSSTGTAYFANDGGVYSRPTSLHGVVRWKNLNADLHTLQYYYAGVGRLPNGSGDGTWGGLQDNGSSLLRSDKKVMVSPQGGDGGDVLVDPDNADRAVVEYVYLNMASTTNGGRSDGSKEVFRTISPACASVGSVPKPCDPTPRFIAPFDADPTNVKHWVAGGEYVWDNKGKGWATSCTAKSCDWKIQHDVGTGGSVTALAVVGKTTYAGWCGNGCNPGGALPFTSGIDTNYGGTWHRATTPNLPNRYPTAVTVDSQDAAHVYLTYGAFSRRWIPGAGVGHVFESHNGGGSWKDISGNLPDVPVNDVVVFSGRLLVGTDIGVFGTDRTAPGRYSRVGTGLPHASTNDLVVAPGGRYVLAATHGRGMWRFGG